MYHLGGSIGYAVGVGKLLCIFWQLPSQLTFSVSELLHFVAPLEPESLRAEFGLEITHPFVGFAICLIVGVWFLSTSDEFENFRDLDRKKLVFWVQVSCLSTLAMETSTANPFHVCSSRKCVMRRPAIFGTYGSPCLFQLYGFYGKFASKDLSPCP